MGKKSSAPAPAPDPAIGQAALAQAQYGKEYLDFAKQQYAEGLTRQDSTDALVKQVADSAMGSQAQADKWAGEDRQIQADYRTKYDDWASQDRNAGMQTRQDMNQLGQQAMDTGGAYESAFGAQSKNQYQFAGEEQDRYKSLFRPVQDRIVSDAMNWDSEGRLDSEAAKAKADVVSGAAQQQQAQQRNMASMGIDPRSGRFQGIDRATSLNTALAGAGAQNVARDNVRSQAIQLRGQAGQLGQQVIGNANNATTLGMQASSQALNANTNAKQLNMQAKNLGLAAAGIGNSSASLGMGNQGGGYAGLGLGLTAGNSALGANAAGNGAFNANAGIMGQGFGAAASGAAGQAGTLNNLYGNQLQAWGIQNQASGQAAGGMGNMLGQFAGAAASMY